MDLIIPRRRSKTEGQKGNRFEKPTTQNDARPRRFVNGGEESERYVTCEKIRKMKAEQRLSSRLGNR